MVWVYLLVSRKDRQARHIGITDDVDRRLKEHNSGKGGAYSAKYASWELEIAIRFRDRAKAERFERYLKSGSGHAFARRHFW